jgi:hypothetical protein
MVPDWLRSDVRQLSPQTRRELEQVGTACRTQGEASTTARLLLDRILPQVHRPLVETQDLNSLLEDYGFDREQHEQIRQDLRSGLIGLAQNRLPPSTTIEDVEPADVMDLRPTIDPALVELGTQAIADGQVGVLTLAAGVGSRWTEGAGVVKALHPFCRMAAKHRCFLEIHLAKTRKTQRLYRVQIPHLFATGYLTHGPIECHLAARNRYGFGEDVILSPGRAVGLRTIPMVRDLHFAWEEMPQQILDEQQQKVRSSLRAALVSWATQMGEGEDYTDNLPIQCLHPVGHWYEFPNLLRNGVLGRLLQKRPKLKYLMLHNVDTLGASIDPGVLGMHIDRGHDLSFEVIPRRLDDRGGGLARVDGHPRLLEGLALPREEDEFRLSYYNSMTTWISLDPLLKAFGLQRDSLVDPAAVDRAVRRMARRLPTYITIKDVKKRWGHGQEDVYPVTQFEKLWSDMSGLREVHCGFFVVPLVRGQQLKQPSQLDGWLRDGSAQETAALCEWYDE